MLGFNDTSTLVGHFVSSPREREKSERKIVEEIKERDREERNRNESEETEKIKIFPIYPYLLQGQQALPNCKPISVGRPGDVRYTTPSHHPTTPNTDQIYRICSTLFAPHPAVLSNSVDKSGYQVNIFLISQWKHMLWVLIRSASMRRF